MSKPVRLVRFSILCYRKPGMSEDEFHGHWRTKHAQIVREWLKKHGVIKYTQYHTPSSSRTLTGHLTGNIAQSNIAEYDGFVELLVREDDFDCLERARRDPYYKDVVAPDEEKFFDMSRCQTTAEWEEVYVEDGKIVDVAEGEANVVTASS